MTTISGSIGRVFAALVLLGAGVTQADTTICALIEAQNQSKLSAAGQATATCGTRIEILSLNYSVTSPRDQATGQPAGSKQHKPVRITKRWNAASPQLFQALNDGELLSRVSLDFVTVDPRSGKPRVERTINLTNAFVTAIEHSVEAPSQTAVTASSRLLDTGIETIELTFQQIELIDTQSNVSAKDP